MSRRAHKARGRKAPSSKLPSSPNAQEVAEEANFQREIEGLPTLPQDLLEAYGRLHEQARRRTIALATAAHELKTPLAIISGYVEVLLDQKSGPLSDRQRQILEDVQSNCKRLEHFIEDFLEDSALETGKLTTKLELGDLKSCLSEVYDIWLPRFKEKEVALYFPLTPDLEPFLFDYDKVQHIVSNLLENSLKFTPAGGTVWLTAEKHHWERRAPRTESVFPERRRSNDVLANSVRVTVADTGPGIEAEYHQEIFDEFFKLPGPEGSESGTGLGLAIARRLVQAHGGKIWVEGEPAAGSKFCFLLPLRLA